MIGGYDPSRIRGRLRWIQIPRVYRLIHCNYRSNPLGAVAAPSRFSDPVGSYAVLYAAQSIRCAFWEALARNRFTRRRRRELPHSDVADRMLVVLRSEVTVTLVDLRGDGPVHIGAPPAVAHDTSHVAGRALSAAVHAVVPEADGFLYQSRFTGDACVAVFDRAIGKLALSGVAPLISVEQFWHVLDVYDIALTTP